MPKESDPGEVACSFSIWFKTEDEAKRSARRMDEADGGTRTVFKCKRCGNYHIQREKL